MEQPACSLPGRKGGLAAAPVSHLEGWDVLYNIHFMSDNLHYIALNTGYVTRYLRCYQIGYTAHKYLV